VAVMVFAGACGGSSGHAPDNVILFVFDTTRADVLGCYGGDAHTPNIDRLAAEGLMFSNARSHVPITGPSHSSLFVSKWPQEHGFTNNAMQLPEKFVTMAQLLRDQGYRTAAFVSLGVLKGNFGFSRGFDYFNDTFGIDWFHTAGEINEEVESYLETLPKGRHFLWIHYSDPHEPYQDPDSDSPDFRVFAGEKEVAHFHADGRRHVIRIPLKNGKAELRFAPGNQPFDENTHLNLLNAKTNAGGSLEAGTNMFAWIANGQENNFVCDLPAVLKVSAGDSGQKELKLFVSTALKRPQNEVIQAYIRELEYADRQLGVLLDRFRKAGLLENTLVILAADHGEGLGQHRLGGHIEQLYDSLLHVPLIFHFPGRIPAGVVDERPVGLVDVLPTVAAMTGISVDTAWRGVDLLAENRTGRSLPLVAATYRPEATHNLEAVVDGALKLIRNRDNGKLELYNLKADPDELKDLAGEKPEEVRRLEKQLNGMLEGIEAPPKTERVLDEETRDKLRALGYAD